MAELCRETINLKLQDLRNILRYVNHMSGINIDISIDALDKDIIKDKPHE